MLRSSSVRILAVLALVFIETLSVGSAAAWDRRVKRGELIALANCARCHAVARFGSSPLREAPPFRALHERYPVGDLAEALVEGITTGHPTMPEFRLEPDEADALIAYMKSLAN
ncbi:MAG: cytochrome c [Methylobacterium sp.]|uniref:c-type cytochrome n=1 Tax=Methylobacterium sp. TaxID=409 RepID=UPI0025DB4361|nr:cytochrome c [Methylobacterium sp.]MBX9930549.1 cytochrome c [Methylobacterium sp.]